MTLVLVQKRRGGFKARTAMAATLLALGAAGCGDQADDRSPASGGATSAGQVPAKPEAGTLKLGTQPWIGYGPFTLAKENGLFDREQLSVEVSTFKEDKQINAALASGRLDAVNAGTIQALTFAAAGLPVKIVMLQDVSGQADAILAKSEIASIAELKGKRVAYEEGTTGEVLLRYALQENGLTIDDVEKVPLSATEAGPAVIAGRVDAAYTYEPFVSAALKRGDGLKALYTAAEKPGIISDVLLVRQEVIDDRPGQVAALVRSWQAGLDAYEADPDGSQATIAEDLGADLAELKDAFSGIEFYDVARNRQEASSGQLAETVQIVADVAKQAGLIEGDVDVEALIEPRFVNAGS